MARPVSDPAERRFGPALRAAFAAWLIPGLGHFLLGRRGRAGVFFTLVLFSLVLGCLLHGRLPWQFSGSPLAILASIGGLGTGLAYLVAKFAFDSVTDPTAPGYEYGGAFIITAGLMNWLLVLDAWDIAHGRDIRTAGGPAQSTEDDDPGEAETASAASEVDAADSESPDAEGSRT